MTTDPVVPGNGATGEAATASGTAPDPVSAEALASAETLVSPRQRWRLGLARSADAPPLVGRGLMDAWDVALDRSGLPLMRVGRGPARIVFGAPLPAAMAAERELAEIVLSERCPVWRVREALESVLPDGWRLASLDDVWLGAPSLPGVIAAADYRIELGEAGPAPASATSVVAAAAALLRATRLPRQRTKGGGVVTYDLRPLLVDLAVADAGPPNVVVRTRTLLHPTLGSGRPEEVAAALAEAAGIGLRVVSIVRERLVLADELGARASG